MKFLWLLFFVLVGCQNGRSQEPEKLVLAVYYESKCPDSMQFIVEQLVPAVNLLRQHIVVQLIPFGKANSVNDDFNEFECQHGPPECLGNLMQSCSLNYMAHKSDIERVAYVACEMQTMAGTEGSTECVAAARLPVNKIIQCMISDEGTQLQKEAERRTKMYNPKYIPTITINGVFDQEIQDNAQENLIATLCSQLPDVEACKLPCDPICDNNS